MITVKIPVSATGQRTLVVAESKHKAQVYMASLLPLDMPSDVRRITEDRRICTFDISRFTTIHLTGLFEDDDDPATLIAVEVVVFYRLTQYFRAIYSINDCDSEIKFNKWGK